jgi:trehalose-phosphatase
VSPATVTAPAALAVDIARAARRRGAARALILDLDGTLAPIAARPRDARVPVATLRVLARLVTEGWRIAIVSGRSAADARRLVPLPGVVVFGSHGIERHGAPSSSKRLRRIARRVGRITRAAPAVTRGFAGVIVERKPFGCAFHHRALDARARERFRRRLALWLSERDTRGLALLEGNRVVELRPAGLDKGVVLRRWHPARSAKPSDRSLVAIGDDRTDEDLFAACARRGLTVSVGPEGRATLARRRLRGTTAVRRVLTLLAKDAGAGANR